MKEISSLERNLEPYPQPLIPSEKSSIICLQKTKPISKICPNPRMKNLKLIMQVFMNNPPLKRILMKICKFLLFQNLKIPIRPNNQNSFKFQSFFKFFLKFKLLNILMCLIIILIYHIKFTYKNLDYPLLIILNLVGLSLTKVMI